MHGLDERRYQPRVISGSRDTQSASVILSSEEQHGEGKGSGEEGGWGGEGCYVELIFQFYFRNLVLRALFYSCRNVMWGFFSMQEGDFSTYLNF